MRIDLTPHGPTTTLDVLDTLRTLGWPPALVHVQGERVVLPDLLPLEVEQWTFVLWEQFAGRATITSH